MGILTCTYPKCDDVAGRIAKLVTYMGPVQLCVDRQDVYAASLQKLERVLNKEDAERYVPYLTMRENAKLYGPQYGFTAELDGMTIATGSINSISVDLTVDDEYNSIILDRMQKFATDIPGAIVELENDFGDSIAE